MPMLERNQNKERAGTREDEERIFTMIRHLAPLCDIGANLTDPMFTGLYRGKQKHVNDMEDIMRRAREGGVSRIIVTGGNLSESKEALDLARKYDGLYCTVGVHPTRCSEFPEEESDKYFEELEVLIKDGVADGKVVAIGECGLDYDRLSFCDKDRQKSGFLRHFKLAHKSKLPMFLHNRNTGADFVNIMKEQAALYPSIRGVVHSFTGELDEALMLLDLGLYIGINGCSLKTEENLRVLERIPVDKILLETDAPWCGIKPTHASHKYVKTTFDSVSKPEKWQVGKTVKDRCEPCHLVQVLEVVAAVLGVTETDLSHQVETSTNTLFFDSKK